jgi:hypothetical protein
MCSRVHSFFRVYAYELVDKFSTWHALTHIISISTSSVCYDHENTLRLLHLLLLSAIAFRGSHTRYHELVLDEKIMKSSKIAGELSFWPMPKILADVLRPTLTMSPPARACRFCSVSRNNIETGRLASELLFGTEKSVGSQIRRGMLFLY